MNQFAVIQYQLPEGSFVSLSIYNITGQILKTIVAEYQKPGYYSVKWDGRDEAGRKMSSGIYFYRLSTPDFVSTKRIVLLR